MFSNLSIALHITHAVNESPCMHTPRTQPLIKGSAMALICNKVQKSLWVWLGEASWNGWSPQVHLSVCLIDLGPPGPPDKVAVEEITDSTAQISWTPGRDNGSPITGYIIQARTPFTVGWQAVDTGMIKHSPCPLVVFIRVLFIY